jgi:GTP-binding protein YchF
VKVGIVGLPNAGKSSLFNALTRQRADMAMYPFSTVEPNVATVQVPDERLDAVVATVGATPTVYETIEFHDIAGLVRGASKGEGLGNKFLANIREVDAIVHVVRAFESDLVAHPHGEVDPVADIEVVETELLYADLEQAERRLEKVAKEAKSGEREKVAERDWLERLVAALQAGEPARAVPVPEDAPDALRNLQPLTAKPVLYLTNVDEDAGQDQQDDDGRPIAPLPPAGVQSHAERHGARAAAVCARLEFELNDLGAEEAAAMRIELGIPESSLTTIVREAWELLGLISFFTAGEGKEGRAWAIPRGIAARRAAGKIHTDNEKGFVAAEVISWEDLVATGGYAAAREQGKLRVEGRDYEMRDGDVMTVRFTP